jgi:hypothetical protein
LTFVASDSWGTKTDFLDYFINDVAEGAITFAPKSYDVKGIRFWVLINPNGRKLFSYGGEGMTWLEFDLRF